MRSTDLQDFAATYAAVLDALPIVAFLARPDGSFSYVSAHWTAIIGSHDSEILADAYPSLIDPDCRERAVRTWLAACASGRPYRDELRFRFADGAYRWILSEAYPLRDPDTAVIIAWFGTLTDINERKLTEETLRAAVEFNTRLIDSSDDCIKILDLDARLVSLSPNGQKLLRIMDVATVVGTSWINFWHGDDRTAAQAAVRAALAGRTGGFTGYFPVEGEPRWFEVTVTAILDAVGKPEKLLAVSRDRTAQRLADDALRESEQRYRAFSEALPGMTWSASPDGRLDFLPEHWSASRGRAQTQALGDAWLESVHPDDRESTRERWRSAIESGQPYENHFRVMLADGTYRWQLVRAQPMRDDTGTITRWIGVNVDVDDQHRADAARDMFVSLSENSSDFIGIADPDGNTVYINEAGRALLEIPPDAALSATHILDYFRPDDRAYVRDEILPAVRSTGRWVGDFRFANFRTGAPVAVAFNLFSLVDRNGAVSGIATLSRDRRHSDRIGRGLQLLSRTGAATLDLLDQPTTLRNIAGAFLPDFASYCMIDIITPDAHWERTVVHRDPTKESLIAFISAPSGDHPIALALALGTSSRVVFADGTYDQLRAYPDRMEVARALEVRSFITVPVVMPNGTIVGGLTCVRDAKHPGGDYDDDEMAFVGEAGRRAGAAIANARLYDRERRIAVELQAASLPATLPQVDHLRLYAEYRPGSDEATIGGDWYDAFVLEDGRVAITLGDVLGHGLQAAVTMTKLRQAMQSAAMIDPDPNVMLRVADKTLRLLDPDRYATAIAAIYNPQRQTLTFASAGHPGPVVRDADGRVRDYRSPGAMLGLRSGDEADVAVIPAPADSTIVLFTDGLIEATRDVEAGFERLHAAVALEAIVRAVQPARAIVDAVLATAKASDDIAVLVIRTGAASGGAVPPTRQSTYRDVSTPLVSRRPT